MKFLREQIAIAIASVIAAFLLVEVTESQTERILRQAKALWSGANRFDGTTVVMDSLGIPIVDYGDLDGVRIGPQRNPVSICQQAFYYFDRLTESDGDYRRRALNCADWLVDSAEIRDYGAVLPYRFAYPRYRLPGYWLSAMAQAQALQVMVLAHRTTGDDSYLRQVVNLLGIFFVDVDSGGVTHKSLDGSTGWWYEEYAAPDGRDPRVLNGMLYTLLGLYELYEYTHDSTAQFLFLRGYKSLTDFVHRYDRNGHSYYDVLGNPVGGDYHQIHIELLDSLYRITGDSTLRVFRDRWREYAESPFIVRLLRAPTRIAPLVLTVNAVLVHLVIVLVRAVLNRTR